MQRQLIGRISLGLSQPLLQRTSARWNGTAHSRIITLATASATASRHGQSTMTPLRVRHPAAAAAVPGLMSVRHAAAWTSPRRVVTLAQLPAQLPNQLSRCAASFSSESARPSAGACPLLAPPPLSNSALLPTARGRRSHRDGAIAPFSSAPAAAQPTSAPRPAPAAADATAAASSNGAAVAAAPSSSAAVFIPAAAPSSLLFRLSPSSFHPYLLLARADKPVGTWLLLLPCLWSLGLAAAPGTLIDLKLAAVMAVGAFVMRGAGCTINDLWDRDFDRQVARTRDRPLASGLVTVPQALTFLAAQLGVGLAVVLQLNWMAIGVAMCSIPLVVIYPLMKRYTYWPQFVLGLTFNWGVWVGWAAVHGAVDVSLLAPLYAAGVCWTLVYDTIYAHQDVADDVLIGVKSTALNFGAQSTQWLSGFATSTVALLAATGYAAGLGPIYGTVAVAGGALHLVWQLSTVRFSDRASCNAKFISNVRFGWLVLLGIVVDRLCAEGRSRDQEQKKDETKQQLEGDKQQSAVTAISSVAACAVKLQ